MGLLPKLDSPGVEEGLKAYLTMKPHFRDRPFWYGWIAWKAQWKAYLCTFWNKHSCKIAHSRLLNGNLHSRRDKDTLLAKKPSTFNSGTFRYSWLTKICLSNKVNTIKIWKNKWLLLKVLTFYSTADSVCQVLTTLSLVK